MRLYQIFFIFHLLQTLMSVPLQQTSVTRMLHVKIPKDLTTALVKMDLKATEKTAQVRFSLEHNRKKLSYRQEEHTERKIRFDCCIYFLFS